MKRNRTVFALITLVLLLSVGAACSPRSKPVEEIEPVIVATEAEPAASDVEPTLAEGEGEELGPYGQPIDVPIMDNNRDLQISRTGENMSYKVDTVTLQDVMTYYQDNLTAAGWTPGPNENPVGARNLVTLARTNEAADRVTVTMQHNPIGEFVVVSIVLTRAP
jgi:hypothetical protein